MHSIEEFTALSIAVEKEEFGPDFWYVVNRLPNEHLILWAERLSKTKYLSNKNPEYWLDLLDLIRIAKDPMNQILTSKQKRYLAMLILECWNELECDYVL